MITDRCSKQDLPNYDDACEHRALELGYGRQRRRRDLPDELLE